MEIGRSDAADLNLFQSRDLPREFLYGIFLRGRVDYVAELAMMIRSPGPDCPGLGYSDSVVLT
jgi:hypothetical protein